MDEEIKQWLFYSKLFAPGHAPETRYFQKPFVGTLEEAAAHLRDLCRRETSPFLCRGYIEWDEKLAGKII